MSPHISTAGSARGVALPLALFALVVHPPPRRSPGSQRGIALPLALFALVMLTGLLLVLVSIGGMEPTVAANLDGVTRARYVAESGLEWAFDRLVAAAGQPNGWSTVLSTNSGQMATGMALPNLPAAFGTFSVTVRNDNLAGDVTLTGKPACNAQGASDCGPGDPATTDNNNTVILSAAGTYNGATRQIQQVVSYPDLRMPGGLILPGVGTNTDFDGSAFTISGNDTNVDGSEGAGTATCPAQVWGISVRDAVTEDRVQASLSESQERNVTGKAEGPGPGSGDNTIAIDGSLTQEKIAKFVEAVKPYADISLRASAANQLVYENLGDTCAANPDDGNCWGTRSNPKIVYVKGTVDPAQAFYALGVSGTSSGAGILIVEDGDLSLTGNFRWEGIILITGQYVGLRYGGGGNQTIYGGVIVNETAMANAEVEVVAQGNAKILYSCEALNNVLPMRKMFRTVSWREV